MSNPVAPPDQYHADPVVKRTLDWLRGLVPTLNSRIGTLEGYGLQKRTRGVANVSTSASATGTATVTHGLGTTPNHVQLTAQNSSGAGLAACAANNVGATTFDANIRFGDGVARTTTIVVGWEAIA